MKVKFIAVLAIIPLLFGCSTTPNHSTNTAQKYLEECKYSDNPPALGNIIGWPEVRQYWESVPELKESRSKFKEADQELWNILMSDDEFRLAYQKSRDASTETEREESSAQFREVQGRVYTRMQGESHEYQRAREKRDEALLASNIRTLEYIINDYEKQGKEFPVERLAEASNNNKWMPSDKFMDFVSNLSRNGFFKDRNWVTEVNGRCSEDGKIEYKFTYEPVPSKDRSEWYWWFGMNDQWFENRKQLYAGSGLEMVHEQSFALPNGERRNQAVWRKSAIKLSKTDKKHTQLREEAYGPWIPIIGYQDQANFRAKQDAGMMPLYSDREPGRIREIFIPLKEGSRFHVSGMTEEALLKSNRNLEKVGFVVLVVIHDNAAGGYWANWVNRESYDEYVDELSRFGISPGTIEQK